jgi:hypothetical protein
LLHLHHFPRSHRTVGIKVFSTIFAWVKKDPERLSNPDSYLVLLDPDRDPGGSKHTIPADPDPAPHYCFLEFCIVGLTTSDNLVFPLEHCESRGLGLRSSLREDRVSLLHERDLRGGRLDTTAGSPTQGYSHLHRSGESWSNTAIFSISTGRYGPGD